MLDWAGHEALRTRSILEQDRHLCHFYGLSLGEAQALIRQVHAGLLLLDVGWRDKLIHARWSLLDLAFFGRVGCHLMFFKGDHGAIMLKAFLIVVPSDALVSVALLIGERGVLRHFLLCEGEWLHLA